MSELIELENLTPATVFSDGGIDPVLVEISEKARSIVPDVETAKGRKEIASVAHQIAKSKTYLDGMGKALVADWKAKAKVVDSSRKHMRDYLDTLKVEIRQPLTEYEAAEQKRIDDIQAKVKWFEEMEATEATASDAIAETLDSVKSVVIDETFAEFANQAAQAKDSAIRTLERRHHERKTAEAEAAELDRLRKAEAERQRKAEEDRIRQEAADKARRDEEMRQQEKIAKAEQERKDAERRAKDAEESAKRQKEEAERQAVEAAERAKREAEAAARKERERIESEKAAEEAERQRREANKRHRAKIEKEVVAAFAKQASITNDEATRVYNAILDRWIPHVSIEF